MRKITGAIVLFISMITGICLTAGPGKAVRYSECMVSAAQAENVSLAFVGEAISGEGIKRNGTIWFLAYTDEVCCTYGLKCTTLPLMRIECGQDIRYLELFINGRYWGLYALGYPIDEKRVCTDPDSSDAVLYKHGLLEKQGDEGLRFTKDGDIFGSLEESPDENLRRQTGKFRVKSRNFTEKGLDMVLELSVKYPEKLSEAIRATESVKRFSIIEYDSDDIL